MDRSYAFTTYYRKRMNCCHSYKYYDYSCFLFFIILFHSTCWCVLCWTPNPTNQIFINIQQQQAVKLHPRPFATTKTAMQLSSSASSSSSTTTTITETDNDTATTIPPADVAASSSSSDSNNDNSITAEQCDDQLAEHIRNNHWEGVLEVLQQMQDLGYSQTDQTFYKCLQACTTTSTTTNTTTITDTTLLLEVWNALIQTVPPTFQHVEYVVQHCPMNKEDVWSILRQSSFTYNTALQIVSQQGQWKVVLREWKQQQQQQQRMDNESNTTTRIEFTQETYRAIWKVCIQANDCPIDAILQILSVSGTFLATQDVEDIFTTLTRPPQPRSWKNVITIWEFIQQHYPQLVSLQCYQIILSHRYLPWKTAHFLLRQLQRHGKHKPTIEIYNRVMYLMTAQGSSSSSNVSLVLQLLQELQQKYNLAPNVVTYTHVIRACLADKQWQRALVVFEVAQDKLTHQQKSQPQDEQPQQQQLDVYLYTAAMEACVQSKQYSRAIELLEEMQQPPYEIVPNSYTYRVAMQAAPHRALELLNALKKQHQHQEETDSTKSKSTIPLITYNAALQALAQMAKQQVKQQDQSSSSITNHTTTVNTTTIPIWQHAVNLLEEIKQQNLQPDGFTYNAVIMCCCHGPWELALHYIQEMQDSSQPPNRLVYTAAIASCGKHGQADHALQLLAQMKQHKIQPDLVTYNAVFTALRVAQKPKQALELWNELLKQQNSTQPSTLSRILVNDRTKRQYTTGKVVLVPDIITITEVIGTLEGTHNNNNNNNNNSSSESDDYQAQVDSIVAYAVKRKLLLNGFLDSSNEINLSGLTFPVARAACRYLLQRYQHVKNEDLTLITGVGRQQNKTSLRDYLQEWLESEFDLKTSIPRFAQGTLVLSSESLVKLGSRKK